MWEFSLYLFVVLVIMASLTISSPELCLEPWALLDFWTSPNKKPWHTLPTAPVFLRQRAMCFSTNICSIFHTNDAAATFHCVSRRDYGSESAITASCRCSQENGSRHQMSRKTLSARSVEEIGSLSVPAGVPVPCSNQGILRGIHWLLISGFRCL